METAAREIFRLARDLAGETERERHLPESLLAPLRRSGMMSAGAPHEVGGLELPPAELLASAEEIARGDASAGWCVSIAATSSLLAGYLTEQGRAQLFADPETIAAGIFAPRGRALPVDGGFVVDGRWSYCSGITHASVLFAGCLVHANDREEPGAGLPITVALPRGELEVLDTWHTLGLRGTGSHDAVARQVFVPAERSFSLFDGPQLDRPLYRFPVFGYFAASIAAAALGNARGAIEEFAELAAVKVGQGSSRTLAGRSSTQAAVAEAEASLRAARALYYGSIAAAWDASQAHEPVPVPVRNELRLASTHAVRASAAVVGAVYDLAGGPAIYDDSPLQRRFRDAHTATAHFQVNAASHELQGRLLLGLPAETLMI